MRIGLDARMITRNPTGIGRVARELVRELLRLDGPEEYHLYSNRALPDGFVPPEGRHGTAVARLPLPLWQAAALPLALWRDKVQVFHSHVFGLPWRRAGCRTVLTMHDLTFEIFPQHDWKDALKYQVLARWSAERVDHLIADSENTRQDLMDLYRIPESRITVVRLGVAEAFRPQSPEAMTAVRALHELPERYLLYVGVMQPRRNLSRLLEAYARIQRGRADCPPLVLVGGGWYEDALRAQAATLGLGGLVRFLGHVPDEELPALYAGAQFLVYPSLYEGFGLPPLEAMACGCPVIVSWASSLPEVVGDAGLQVNPYRVEAMADAMLALLEDDGQRARLRAAGLERAKQFSWAKAAAETAAVFRTLA